MKTGLFILLFILGCMFSMAGYGANERKQKITYWSIAILIWIALLILGNIIL